MHAPSRRGLFPDTLSLMKVAKSPGGLKSTVCLCSREHSRGTGGGWGCWGGGGKVVKLWESRLTERRDRGGVGVPGSVVEIEVLTRLRPPDRFPDTYK